MSIEVENKGGMPCRHPYSKCVYMIGLVKKYRKPVKDRTCGVASLDDVCKRISCGMVYMCYCTCMEEKPHGMKS